MHRPEDICLDILRLYDRRCVQKANTLTLLVQKADTMALVVRTTFALTTYIGKRRAASRRETSGHYSSRRKCCGHCVRTHGAVARCSVTHGAMASIVQVKQVASETSGASLASERLGRNFFFPDEVTATRHASRWRT